MSVAGVSRALPPHYYSQQTFTDAISQMWGDGHYDGKRLASLHQNVEVGGRYTALPIERYASLTFEEANNAYIKVAVDLGAQAITSALQKSGYAVRDVDHLLFVSGTGIATPSIDARLVNRLGLRADVKRTPIFGLGCAGGVAGMARVSDYLRGFPDHVAVLLSVELCSLTLQKKDPSLVNMIAFGLFGDGAAAVVMAGASREAQGPRVVATRSVFYPDTEHITGWNMSSEGFGLVLSAHIPKIVEDNIENDVTKFLADQSLTLAELKSYVCHPGGPKVRQAVMVALGLSDDDMAVTKRSITELGNISSASVLLVLQDTIETRRPAKDALGLMMSMGPGFCSELLLLKW